MTQVASCKFIPQWLFAFASVNASPAHAFPGFLVAGCTRTQSDASVTKPFRWTNGQPIGCYRILLVKGRQGLTHLLHLFTAIPVEHVTWIAAVGSVHDAVGVSVPFHGFHRTKSFPTRFPHKPVSFVV